MDGNIKYDDGARDSYILCTHGHATHNQPIDFVMSECEWLSAILCHFGRFIVTIG